MTSKIWLINLFLAVCFVLMGFNAWQVWTGEMPEQKMPVRTGSSPEKSDPIRPVKGKTAPESQYSVIAEKNLFDPDRREELPEEVGVSAVAEKKTGGPIQNIVLYGVILMKDYQKALVQTADAGSGKSRWVTVGESVGSMTVSAIEKERIVLNGDEGNREIFLHGGKKRDAGSSLAGNSTPDIINTAASENEKTKNTPPSSPKAETKPAAADHNADKSAGSNDISNPVFGGIDRRGQTDSTPAAENNNSAPVFGGGGNKGDQKKEEGNAQPNPVMNPFLQLLQKNSGNQ